MDIKLLVDWCCLTGMSIIQLLPMNDVGFNFRPYDAQSTFALDPMYLSILELKNVKLPSFKREIELLKKNYPTGASRVNYKIKSAKLGLLWKIFQSVSLSGDIAFDTYLQKNSYWLEDYSFFKVIKELNQEKPWEEWEEPLKLRGHEALQSLNEEHVLRLSFYKWLQWQLYEQFKEVKTYAQGRHVLLMGDLPLLVSRDSVDVWAHQEYFKLGEAAGAPSDMLYSKGQRWGMPPYHWELIAQNRHDYLIEKLKYAQNFYDLYRIDHSVGIFRLWTIPLSQPLEEEGLHGFFVPKDEHVWESHGRELLAVMIKNSEMLACAEDLGTIPACSYKVLKEFGIPGIDVQRWLRDWDKSFDFKDPALYRKNSISTLATHDMTGLSAWWKAEAGTVDEELFKRKCREKNIFFEQVAKQLFDVDKTSHGRLHWRKDIKDGQVLLDRLGTFASVSKDFIDLYKGSFDEKKKFLDFLGMPDSSEEEFSALFIKRVLEAINKSASIFSIQLLQDWLTVDDLFDYDPWELRINVPGTISEKNWSTVIPIALEDLLSLPLNDIIKTINEESGRI